MKSILKALLLTAVALGYASAQSPWSTTTFAPGFTATATGQTSPPIPLGIAPSNLHGAFAIGTVTVTGVALNSVTFQILGSGDNGVTYHPLNFVEVLTPASPASSATATSSDLYLVQIPALTHLEFVTTGTFNATSVNFLLTASPIGAIAKNSAPLDSPALTGTPTAPTPAAGTNTNQLATTAFVLANEPAAPSPATAVPLMDGTAAAGASLLYARQDHVHPTDTTRAPLFSPTFTGTPAAPTAPAGTNTTQLATTAFVLANTQAPVLKATTGSIGGSLINLGCNNQAPVSVLGALNTMTCVMSGAGYAQATNAQPQCFVSAPGVVTPQLCTSITLGLTPTAQSYNIRVF